jgi:hypothetical protein
MAVPCTGEGQPSFFMPVGYVTGNGDGSGDGDGAITTTTKRR